MDRAGNWRLPLDPDARGPLLVLGGLAVLGLWGAWWWVWAPALALFAGVCGFFRDPARPIPRDRGAVVSPADGKVTHITTNEDPEAGPVGGPCISIFLSVLDVHVNRFPHEGTVETIHYEAGRFLNALNPDSGRENESNWLHLRCGGRRLTVRQIAGLIARRIVCRAQEGQTLRRGQRFGLIRFGSRTELYLPPGARVEARVGQKVRGGRSVLAYLPDEEEPDLSTPSMD